MLFRAFKTTWLTATLTLCACANPFSQKAPPPASDFHAENLDCNQVNLGTSNVNASQLRAIMKCLNTHHELESFQVLLKSLSDDDLQPMLSALNHTIQNNVEALYAFRESYKTDQANQLVAGLENSLQLLFLDSVQNTGFSSAFKKLAPELFRLGFGADFHFSLPHLKTLTSSLAYQRLLLENGTSPIGSSFLNSLTLYFRDPSHTPMMDLYDLLARNHVDEAFSRLLKENGKSHVQNLAHILDWLFTEERFSTLSHFVGNLQSHAITCFEDKISLKNPLEKDLKVISMMNPRELKNYFNHDLKNLVLAGQGFCHFHFNLDAEQRLLSEATEQAGFDELFSIIKPILNDDTFIRAMTSSATEKWFHENRQLGQNHFFEDLLTLLALDLEFPLTNQPRNTVVFLDHVFSGFSREEIRRITLWFDPLLNPEQKFGHQLIKTASDLYESYPDLPKKPKANSPDWLQPFLEKVVTKGDWAPALSLTSRLIHENKLLPLLDQGLRFFKNLIDRGQFPVQARAIPKTNFSDQHPIHWQLAKHQANEPLPEQSVICRQLSLDWSFQSYIPSRKAEYLNEMDALLRCVNPNQTFQSAVNLVAYATQENRYSSMIQLENAVINEGFQLNAPLALDTVDAFMDLKREQTNLLVKTVEAFSKIGSLIRSPFLQARLTRNFLASESKQPSNFLALNEFLKTSPAVKKPIPSLDLPHLNQIDVMVAKNSAFEKMDFPKALELLFQEYCPRDAASSSCELDEDQVAQYVHAPSDLIQSIKTEYLGSAQNWLHPDGNRKWRFPAHAENRPGNQAGNQADEFAFHFNPVLHLLSKDVSGITSVFKALQRFQMDHLDLQTFLEERAVRLTLIPYIYQNPGYPKTTSREFHPRIRLRIVSDLDRLELIAINTDFKPFHLSQNVGLGFIRDIGLSWGDEPEESRPKDLASFTRQRPIQTLKDIRNQIVTTLKLYDQQLIHDLAGCKPHGRGALGRWLQTRFCSANLSDLSARLFNLRFMVPLLDRELPTEQGGFNGMRVLRDLFYSLHAETDSLNLNSFPDGMRYPEACLSLPVEDRNPHCHFNLVSLVPLISRLGLFHQASLGILNQQDSLIPPIVSILNRAGSEPDLEKKIARWGSSISGINTIQSGVDFSFSTSRQIGPSLSSWVQVLSRTISLNWLAGALSFFEKYPEWITDYHSLLGFTLESGQTTFQSLERLVRQPDSETRKSLHRWVTQAPDGLATEWADFFSKILPARRIIEEKLETVHELHSTDPLSGLRAQAWLTLLASKKGQETRVRLSNWVQSRDFDQFCDVISDTRLIGLVDNFLLSIHQNPDTRAFLTSCRIFLLDR